MAYDLLRLQTVSCKLSEEERARLRAYTKAKMCSASTAMRQCLFKEIDKFERAQKQAQIAETIAKEG